MNSVWPRSTDLGVCVVVSSNRDGSCFLPMRCCTLHSQCRTFFGRQWPMPAHSALWCVVTLTECRMTTVDAGRNGCTQPSLHGVPVRRSRLSPHARVRVRAPRKRPSGRAAAGGARARGAARSIVRLRFATHRAQNRSHDLYARGGAGGMTGYLRNTCCSQFDSNT